MIGSAGVGPSKASIAAVVLAGCVTAGALFVVTSWTSIYGYLGPLRAQEVAAPGFDAWTGVPHGRTYDCTPLDGTATRRVTTGVPDDLIGRRAVPLPVGFAVGGFIALVRRRLVR